MTQPVALPVGAHYLLCRCGVRHAVVVGQDASGARSVTVVPDWVKPEVLAELVEVAQRSSDYAMADILEPRVS